jgi:hypothetical protein
MRGLCCGALSTDARANVRFPGQARRFFDSGLCLWGGRRNAQQIATVAQPQCPGVCKVAMATLIPQFLPAHA